MDSLETLGPFGFTSFGLVLLQFHPFGVGGGVVGVGDTGGVIDGFSEQRFFGSAGLFWNDCSTFVIFTEFSRLNRRFSSVGLIATVV